MGHEAVLTCTHDPCLEQKYETYQNCSSKNYYFYKSVNYNCIYYTIHEAVVIGEEILDDEAKVSYKTVCKLW